MIKMHVESILHHMDLQYFAIIINTLHHAILIPKPEAVDSWIMRGG